MKADSIIFDLDGTLWDSRKAVAESWTKVISETPGVEGRVTEDDLTKTMGLLLEEIGEILFEDMEKEKRAALMETCCVYENEWIGRVGGVLYPRLEEVLRELSERFRLFIVSNCQDGYIEAFYQAHGLGRFFEDYENPGRTGLPKGENIRLVIERNGLKAPVYVGDTEGDRKAARQAGIPFIWASYGFGDPQEWDEKIGRIGELPEMLEEV
ncbi:HAD family hydrolase [Edaphobacillus lindanitolerans]|uniref:Phosphoglycolate phosphatase n=1 Tax=Edaphobacillus lindanitolerans TaxID=550447 RepID=A0A1U7PK21_9BACI|nr:HAD family hydrolase [Edaphobacillus lindanitolerans]SIT71961.1 phosphoglycolate phosphatase [Edaphobacillus lindanitolerans]